MTTCTQCDACFLCRSFSDRGGVIAQGTNLRLIADLSPVADVHWLLSTQTHVTSLLVAAQHAKRPVGVWSVLEMLTQSLKQKSIVLEHGGSLSEEIKGCVAHAHAHIVSATDPSRAMDRVEEFLSAYGAVKRFHSLSRFVATIIEQGLPRNFIWASNPFEQTFLLVDLKQAQTRQLARRALCFAVETKYLPYELAVDRHRARQSTLLGQTLVCESKFLAAENSSGVMVVIEGLSATGKTTVAASVASKLGGIHVPSGLYFCGFAARMEQWRSDGKSAADDVPTFRVQPISESEATESVRLLAANYARDATFWRLVAQAVYDDVLLAQSFGIVVTVDARGFAASVLSSSQLKIFLTASASTRRRRAVLRSQYQNSRSKFEVVHDQAERDRLDVTRRVGRTTPAIGSVVMCTDNLAVEDVVIKIVGLMRSASLFVRANAFSRTQMKFA